MVWQNKSIEVRVEQDKPNLSQRRHRRATVLLSDTRRIILTGGGICHTRYIYVQLGEEGSINKYDIASQGYIL